MDNRARAFTFPGGEPRRILVRGVNWLGDAVMTMPALRRLREKFPQAHIALLTQQNLRDLWTHFSDLNEVITFATHENPLSIGKRLRAGRFDLALVLPNSPRSALDVWFGGIPERIGYSRPWRSWLLTKRVPPPKESFTTRKRTDLEIRRAIHTAAKTTKETAIKQAIHHIHFYLGLAGFLGADPRPVVPRLEIGERELQAAQAKFLTKAPESGERPTERCWVGISPSAAYGPAKRWPAERFSETIRAISSRECRCCWLGFGGSEDEKLINEIAGSTGVPVLNLAGKTTLAELMSLLKICSFLLTNDSGPMHVAAALGTPVVALFGSTSPELTGPGLPGATDHFILRSDAACSPCFRRSCPIDFRCMTGIGVEQAVEAALVALKLKKESSSLELDR